MLKIMLVAGEVSGDKHGAYLSRSIHAIDGNVKLFGVGGKEMRDAGVDIHAQTSHLGVVGFQEALRFLKPLRSIYKNLSTLVRDERPDAVVLVDNEGFNTTFARSLRNQGIPVIFYFAPQIWLWGTWRAKSIAKLGSLVLAVFPDEAEAYKRAGARVEWVGHPLLDIAKPDRDPLPSLKKAGLDPSLRTVALMPGSRYHELKRLLPIMLDAANRLKHRHPNLQLVLPLSAPAWQHMIEAELDRSHMKDHVVVLTENIYTVLSHCKSAIVKSGTCTLEMALLQVPMVVAYKLNSLSYGLVRWQVKTQYIAMPNILLGEKVVPEFRQRQVKGDRLANETLKFLEDESYATSIRQRFQSLRTLLGSEGGIKRAAVSILEEASRRK